MDAHLYVHIRPYTEFASYEGGRATDIVWRRRELDWSRIWLVARKCVRRDML
jgi:hypothetical protein